jgi:hypothetical protein
LLGRGAATLDREGGLKTSALPQFRRLLDGISHDLSLLLDAHGEARNNVVRNEADFLRENLRACFALANRIQRRRKKAERLLGRAAR